MTQVQPITVLHSPGPSDMFRESHTTSLGQSLWLREGVPLLTAPSKNAWSTWEKNFIQENGGAKRVQRVDTRYREKWDKKVWARKGKESMRFPLQWYVEGGQGAS